MPRNLIGELPDLPRTAFSSELDRLRDGSPFTTGPVLTSTQFPNVYDFGRMLFGDDLEETYALIEDREESKGAHFDAYGEIISPDHPFIGHYNLAGKVSLLACELDEQLTGRYNTENPDPGTEEAYAARRAFAAVAVTSPSVRKFQTEITVATATVIPQFAGANHVVHDFRDRSSDEEPNGRFMKLILPSSQLAEQTLKMLGYKKFNQVLNAALTIVDLAKLEGQIDAEQTQKDEQQATGDPAAITRASLARARKRSRNNRFNSPSMGRIKFD
ncbi:TPA: hypothetical protein EYO12_02950 [Candidatus Saccharibacteria bacterium]|nr:hypothetical protein [Candidatus Saccharibacteria bacterium]HIO88004.1 hypothetical protein [Candidatus Saccharibacteria bacterium]